MSYVWINGELVDKADARIGLFDHGFLYGDGVWEHLRLWNSQPFRLAQTLQLLLVGAQTIGLVVPLTVDELTAALEATARANQRVAGYARVIVSRGLGTVGPDPRKIEPCVIILVEEYQPFPAELYGHGLHAKTVSVPVRAEPPLFRTRLLGRPDLVYAKGMALRAGCLEAVMIESASDGCVVGATEGLVFAVRNGAIVVAAGQCPDSTGAAVVEFSQAAFHQLTRSELLGADEVFIAGTTCGVIGLVQIDGRAIGAGEEGVRTRELRDQLQTLTRSESTPRDQE